MHFDAKDATAQRHTSYTYWPVRSWSQDMNKEMVDTLSEVN